MEKIVREDILGWDSLSEIADSLEKRGFQRTELGRDDEIVMSAGDQDFIAIVEASQDQTPSDYNKRLDTNRHTQVVSTEDYDAFTFTTQRRLWDQHGQIKYAQYQITKEQFETQSQVRTPLEKLNSLAYGDTASIYELYETQAIIDKFYDEFEELRAKAVSHVTGVPEGKGDVKQNYAQTIFDRLIFLHFIQEKKLLDYDQDYLEHNHERVLEEDNDVYEAFYKPLFFEWLATDTEHPDQTLPYLNGGLFTQTDIERDYPEIRLGADKEETNELYTEILDFLGDWNWHADERLDIVDPNRLSPELLGLMHLWHEDRDSTLNRKERDLLYTHKNGKTRSLNTIRQINIDQDMNPSQDVSYEEVRSDIETINEEVESRTESEKATQLEGAYKQGSKKSVDQNMLIDYFNAKLIPKDDHAERAQRLLQRLKQPNLKNTEEERILRERIRGHDKTLPERDTKELLDTVEAFLDEHIEDNTDYQTDLVKKSEVKGSIQGWAIIE